MCQLADAGFRANKNKLNSKNAKRAMVQSRMVKKLKRPKEWSERVEAPEFETAGSRADFGRPSLMQRDVRPPWQRLNFLPDRTGMIVAAWSRRLVDWPSRSLLRGAAGEPVGMDVASGGGDPVNKVRLSSRTRWCRCTSYAKAKNCKAQWDRRTKECVCVG